MKLDENNEKIDDEIEIAELLNEYFVNIVQNIRSVYKKKVKLPQNMFKWSGNSFYKVYKSSQYNLNY